MRNETEPTFALSGAEYPGPTEQMHEAAEATPAAPTKRFVLGNRPALTGIRAIVMVPVVLYHANVTVLLGAWMPLQVFFVLSGFLITAMLASEHQRTGAISLRKFYSSRAVRLLPPLLLTVAALAIFASLVHVAGASQRVWGDSAAALFYSDYRQAFEHDPLYSGFLTQCWSLAVEEQYYLIWAGLLLVALRFGRRKLAYALAFLGVVLCTANRIHLVLSARPWNIHVVDRTYYAFDTRADALFLGCLLGLIATGGHLENWKPRTRQLLAVGAAISTAVMVWILLNVGVGERSLPLVWESVGEIASAVIIVYFVVQPTGLGTRLVGVSVLVLVGNMSYMIYLAHYPIFVAISPSTVGWPTWQIELIRFAVLIPLVVASWYLMEKPLMKWRRRALEPARADDQAPAD